VALSLQGCSSSVNVGPDAIARLTPDGTIGMEQVQVAYIGSGGGGSGALYYHGGAYTFTIGGLGIGGIGSSMISAYGEVYKLNRLADFPRAYAQARYGFALGNKSAGDLWLQNGAGVILHLKAERTGLMLSLGGDAIVISMSQKGIRPALVDATRCNERTNPCPQFSSITSHERLADFG
jgi:hypothetical protein